jgi:murein L,D-transpeptidase YcbB/YkuD
VKNKQTTIGIFGAFLLLVAIGCSTTKNTEEKQAAIDPTLEQKLEKITPHVQAVFANSTKTDTIPMQMDGTLLETSALVHQFYANRDYKPIWSNGDSTIDHADSLISIFSNAMDYGLHPSFYNAGLIQQFSDSALVVEDTAVKNELIAKTDVLITNAYFLMATHLRYGILNQQTLAYEWKKDSLKEYLPSYLDEAIKREESKSYLLDMQPKHSMYSELQGALVNYLDEFELTTDTFDVPHFRKDSLKCYKKVKEVLLAQNYLDSASAQNDSLFIESIKRFQLQHGLDDDAVVGRYSAYAMQTSHMRRFAQAAINLERWKWKAQRESKHIYVNIPAYKLRMIDSSVVADTFRVVVGTQWTKTPEFQSKLTYLTVFPFWHVPNSISTTEILTAVKKDSSYLRKRGYQVFDRERNAVDMKSVNWNNVSSSNFPYRIRQNSGWYNSLGLVTFMFPNKYEVFIHDTNAKSFFNSDVRSYSHGCVRLQDPFRLANYIVTQDENIHTPDSIQSYVQRRAQRNITLNTPIQVYIDYITTEGDADGKIYFYTDIYKKDISLRNAFLATWEPKKEAI